MNPQQAYDDITGRSHEMFVINAINSLVNWDQQVNMPPKGVALRGQMRAYLAQLDHPKGTDPRRGGRG